MKYMRMIIPFILSWLTYSEKGIIDYIISTLKQRKKRNKKNINSALYQGLKKFENKINVG